jgi:phage shock protein A
MGFLISGIRRVAVISVILIAAVVVAVILIASLPSWSTIEGLETRISRLEQRNAVLEQSLKIAELRGAAGLMSYRVNQNDYGAAAELSTGFFNGVREMVSETEDQAVRQNLQAMLQQRDEITAGLAQSDPATKEKLAQIYADFFQIRGAG